MIKKIGLVLLTLLFVLLAFNFGHLRYGLGQLKGQLSIILGAEEVEIILRSQEVHDTIKAKLKLIQEIRDFGFNELGLSQSDNYTNYFDQQGKPSLWVLTACPEFSLEPYTWSFPILGEFPYKGFFDLEKGKAEGLKLKSLGYDTDLSPVEGWSTLGFFRDPILSNMLKRKEGALANLILHELFHGTVFIKDSVQYNENLANFVGDKGALLFLRNKYGDSSGQLEKYIARQDRIRAFSDFMVRMAPILDSTYRSMDQTMVMHEKRELKENAIRGVMSDWDEMVGNDTVRLESDRITWNNTLFADFLRYNSQRGILEQELKERYNGSLSRMILEIKERN